MNRLTHLGDRWKGTIALVFALAATAPLFLGMVDQEEYDLGVFSGRVRVDQLLQGLLPFWHDGLGFGTPLPIGHDFFAYPPVLLTAVLPLETFFFLFWTFQIWLGVFYTIRFSRSLDLSRDVALLCGLTFALAMPTLNYAVRDDWPTPLFTWTLLPVLLFYLHKAFRGGDQGRPVLAALRLGVLAGMFLMRSHPGHLAAILPILALFCLWYLPKLSRPNWLALVAAAVLAAIIALDPYVFVFTEFRQFPDHLERGTQDPIAPSHYLSSLLFPFNVETLGALLTGQGSSADELFARNLRGPFFGAPFMVAAVLSVAWAAVRLTKGDVGRTRSAVATCFVVALAASMLDLRATNVVISGIWLYRDAVVFFGILSAGLLLEAIRGQGQRLAGFVALVLLLQGLQLSLGLLPGFANDLSFRLSRDVYRKVEEPSPFKNWLVAGNSRVGDRLLLSPAVHKIARFDLAESGIYGSTDFERLGFKVVSGWFKGVSMDPIYPSGSVMHGRIAGSQAVLRNPSFLAVGGIRWVLVTESEWHDLQSPFLVEAGRFPLANGTVLTLAENQEAWGLATFLDARAPMTGLPRLSGCPLSGLACRDLRPLYPHALAAPVSSSTQAGRIEARFDAGQRERILLLSVLAHRDWVAREASGRVLPIEPLEGAFLAVRVPAGSTGVELRYRPVWRVLTFYLSFGGLTLGLAALLGLLAGRAVDRARRRHGSPISVRSRG